jgi:hypothetical protein
MYVTKVIEANGNPILFMANNSEYMFHMMTSTFSLIVFLFMFPYFLVSIWNVL